MGEQPSNPGEAVIGTIVAAERKYGALVVVLMAANVLQAVAVVALTVTLVFHGREVCGALNDARNQHVQWIETHAAANNKAIETLIQAQVAMIAEQQRVNEQNEAAMLKLEDVMTRMADAFYDLRKAALSAFRAMQPPTMLEIVEP